MKRWEYKHLYKWDTDTFLTALKRLGNEGWELVSTERTDSGGYIGFLKREKNED